MPKLKLLGISGSLKATSSNTRFLKATATLIQEQAELNVFEGLDKFPFFNPDNEAGNSEVIRFKEQIRQADGVIICTPEYAFGVPGVLKNALDWTVHTGDLNEKPLVAFSCSPLHDGGNKAMASLLLTLSALGAGMGNNAHLSVGDIYKKLNLQGEISDELLKGNVLTVLHQLLESIAVKNN